MLSAAVNPLVFAIILNWNGWQETKHCLASLQRSTYPNLKVIIVDNGSDDDSVTRIVSSFPDFAVVKAGENRGFAGGNNIGIRLALQAGADYVLLLNNDTIVERGLFTSLVREAERDRQVAALNPKIYFLRAGNPKTLWAAGGKTNLWLASSGNRGRGQVDHGQFDQVGEIDFATGCCALVRCSAIDTAGPLNEAYFAYYEDADWSYRFKQNGFTIKYVPQAVVWHAVGAASKVEDRGEGSQSAHVHYIAARNHLWFVRTYAATWQKPVAYPAYFVRRVLYYSLAFVLLRRWSKLRALWRGFLDGIRVRPEFAGRAPEDDFAFDLLPAELTKHKDR
jgi:GT2 family glycosyltransferase